MGSCERGVRVPLLMDAIQVTAVACRWHSAGEITSFTVTDEQVLRSFFFVKQSNL